MSFLDKLLEGVEVEWKTLGEVATFRRGSFPQPYGEPKWYDGEDSMPFVQVVDVGNDMKLVQNTKNKISKLAQPKSVFVPKNTIIVTLQGSIGRVAITNYDSYVDRTLAIFDGFKFEINKKYFAYQLEEKFRIEKENARGSTIKTITKEEFSKFQIPIPPLEVQQKIVGILDKFTDLTAELTAELTARKIQYSYYREQLLSFDTTKDTENTKNVEWKTLGEVANIFDSLHQTPQYSENGLSMIRVTDIKGGFVNLDETLKVSEEIFKIFTKRYSPKKNDLVMSRVGSYGNVGIIPEDKVSCMGQNTVVIEPLINNKYLYYILVSNICQNFIEKNVDGGNQKTLSLKSIKSIPIPIPSLEEQERIVAILDKFDTLTTSISEGLPKEIELRQKQYEYYRNLLLTFPKVEKNGTV